MAVTWLELGAGFLLDRRHRAIQGPGRWSVVLPSVQDGAWLLVLAILCTLIPFACRWPTLRHLSAFTAQLAINLEPCTPSSSPCCSWAKRASSGVLFPGVAIVLAAVFGHGWLQTRNLRRMR
jgi:threonine/homoserine efflux transporter RhtA